MKPTSIRIILTIALCKKWNIRQLNVNNAFLNGVLQEEVFMDQPEGFIQNADKGLVCKLNKATNGLKQSLGVWFDKLKSTLVNHGYRSTKSDNSIFTNFLILILLIF